MKRLTPALWSLVVCLAPASFCQISAARGAEVVDSESIVAVVPSEPISLLPRDLKEKWYVWLQDDHYEDTRGVFSSLDDGSLRVSGDGYGGLITHQEYADYYLVMEYRWGTKTWRERVDRAKDGGLLLHCQGPDGNFGGSKENPGPWMTSIEFQIIEGGVGDILVLRGVDEKGELMDAAATCEVERDRDGEPFWKEGAPAEEFTKTGRINWFGRDPDWEDKLGFRGPKDVDSPAQEWTKIECYAKGDRVTYLVNGIIVNKATKIRPSQGKILLQTEGAEMFVRKLELHPLPAVIPE